MVLHLDDVFGRLSSAWHHPKAIQCCNALPLLQNHNAWHNPVQRLFPVIAIDHGRRRGAHGLILGHRRAAFHDERQCWCEASAAYTRVQMAPKVTWLKCGNAIKEVCIHSEFMRLPMT